MKKNTILLYSIALVFISHDAVAGTHEFNGGYIHNKIENTTTINSIKSETDLKSDNYLVTYSFYSTDLKANVFPELAILNTHPSFLRFGYMSTRHKIENDPSLESKDYYTEGRYSFPNGIGLGGGLIYSDMDYLSSNIDSDSYDIFISVDYSKSEQSNISLSVHDISADSELDIYDSNGYAINMLIEMAFNNMYVIKPSAGFAEMEYDGQNVKDYKNYLLGLEIGVLFNENLSVFVGGDINKARYEDNSDSDSYRLFMNPKYWFNKNTNLSLMIDYTDADIELGASSQVELEGYSGSIFCTHRF